METITLWWTSADRQGQLPMGSLEADASDIDRERVEQEALGMLLDQCADDEERHGILAGTLSWDAE